MAEIWAFLHTVNRILRGHAIFTDWSHARYVKICLLCKPSLKTSPHHSSPPKQLLMFGILQTLLLTTLPCFTECKTLSIVRCITILCNTYNFLSCQLNSDTMLYHWHSFTLTKILLLILIRHRRSHVTCVDTHREKQPRLVKMVLKCLHI